MQGAILIKFASMYLIYIVLYYNLQNMTKSSTVCKLFFFIKAFTSKQMMDIADMPVSSRWKAFSFLMLIFNYRERKVFK